MFVLSLLHICRCFIRLESTKGSTLGMDIFGTKLKIVVTDLSLSTKFLGAVRPKITSLE